MDPEELLQLVTRLDQAADQATTSINNAKAQRMADFETLGIASAPLTVETASLKCHSATIDSLIVFNAALAEEVRNLALYIARSETS